MIVEGTLRKSERYRGKLVDELLMSILRDEWEGLDRREVEKTSGRILCPKMPGSYSSEANLSPDLMNLARF